MLASYAIVCISFIYFSTCHNADNFTFLFQRRATKYCNTFSSYTYYFGFIQKEPCFKAAQIIKHIKNIQRMNCWCNSLLATHPLKLVCMFVCFFFPTICISKPIWGLPCCFWVFLMLPFSFLLVWFSCSGLLVY